MTAVRADRRGPIAGTAAFIALALLACSRTVPAGPGIGGGDAAPAARAPASTVPATGSSPLAHGSEGEPPASARDAGSARGRYPVGRACASAAALAREGKDLPPLERWRELRGTRQRIRLSVPPGVFEQREGKAGLSLVSELAARGLGPDGQDARRFAIRFQRLERSVDALLADTAKTSPLGGAYVEGAFPRRTTASFTEQPEERMRPGAAVRSTVAGRPAFVWVNGVEGYNSDYVLVEIAPEDTLLVIADWSSAVMAGQPECWQRAVIAGVVESLTFD